MRQNANQSQKRSRRKHCKCCDELFTAERRGHARQRYCSKAACQTVRQRKNEKDWCQNNPKVVAYDKSRWLKKHPDYSRKRREADPALEEKNRRDTKIRMQKMRTKVVFDKNKVTLTQMVDKKADKCCLMRGKWIFLRLTRVSPWTKAAIMRHTCGKRLKRIANRLPKSKVYDLTGILKGKDHDG